MLNFCFCFSYFLYFIVGVLIYAIYNFGKPIKHFGKDYASFRRFANELNQRKYPNLSCIPTGLSDFVKNLLHPSPEHRPKLHELSKVSTYICSRLYLQKKTILC